MHEAIETKKEQFKFPDIKSERGEFERVASTFDVDVDTLMFLAEEEGKLTSLDESFWDVLENTDSYKFGKGDWLEVENFADEYTRDWKSLKSKIENGEMLDAPIIVEINGIHHLVSGNTRLMVARALGITPKVLVFEYRHDRTDE
jgi:hypothetical protein